MLALVMDIPRGPIAPGWDAWLFNHAKDHEEIAQAIQTKKTINVGRYNLQEIDPSNTDAWLARHAQAHSEMNAALGTSSVDLSQLDFKNEQQIKGWIWSNFAEHLAVRQTLGI
jgi:hypothetical protein